jgi:primosomal replication protein N
MQRKRDIQQRHRGLDLQVEVAVSTLQAVQYLITIGDPERIRAFLAKHSRSEQLAIKRIMSRESK